MSVSEEELIYDWNLVQDTSGPKAPPRLVDHTLASARLTSWLEMPDLDGQKALLSQLERLGLHHICLGSWSDAQVRKLVETARELEIKAWAEAPPGPLLARTSSTGQRAGLAGNSGHQPPHSHRNRRSVGRPARHARQFRLFERRRWALHSRRHSPNRDFRG